jgi:chromosome segregation ATPase
VSGGTVVSEEVSAALTALHEAQAEVARLTNENDRLRDDNDSLRRLNIGMPQEMDRLLARIADLGEQAIELDAALGENAAHVARIRTLEEALIDMESWIVAAEPLVSFGFPVAFGQWRRPQEKHDDHPR